MTRRWSTRRAAQVAAWLLCLAVIGETGTAQQPIVRTVLDNGSSANRYDLVILGDGYQASEESEFDQDVTTLLVGMFEKEPFASFGSYFNVHSVFRASVDSGASHPDASPPIIRNTAYASSYNSGGTGRCLYIHKPTQALMDAALAPANEARVIVIVNDNRYGGCAGEFAVSYSGSQMVEVQVHELGHNLALLADEYDYPHYSYSGPEPDSANITTSPPGQKWSHWWGFGGVSSHEGAGYYRHNLYRPAADCLMRTLGASLCAVCREQIARSINAAVNTIESPSPTESGVSLQAPETQTFSFTSLTPQSNDPVISWELDGQLLPGQHSSTLHFDTSSVATGNYTLTVTVTDHSSMVRQDPLGAMQDSHSWNLSVTNPSAVNLRLGDIWTTPGSALAGSSITLHGSIHNDGPSGATNISVAHFLSENNTVDASDLSLGSINISQIPSGQPHDITRTVQLPFEIEKRSYYVLAIIDYDDSVSETNESDNVAWTTIDADTVCEPKMEFGDVALYPRDHASVSIAQGGSVSPTVIARCVSPQSLYFITWSFSGTNPGTQLTPSITVPLNQDLWTLLCHAGTNGPIFQQFLGVLGDEGVGRATFHWPAGLPLNPMQGHFAALIVDPLQSTFIGVTNPIGIELR